MFTSASHVLNPKSSSSGSAEVIPAAKVIIVKRAALLTSKTTIVWEIPPGLVAMQVLPDDVLHFVYSDDRELFLLRDVPPPSSEHVVAGVARPVIFDGPQCFLAHGGGRLECLVKVSRCVTKKSELGCLLFGDFAKKM